MKVSQSRMVGLLVTLGVDTARGWDLAKINARVNDKGGISRYLDEGQVVSDPDAAALFDAVVAEQVAGNIIEVVAGDPLVEVPAPADVSPLVPHTPGESETFSLTDGDGGDDVPEFATPEPEGAVAVATALPKTRRVRAKSASKAAKPAAKRGTKPAAKRGTKPIKAAKPARVAARVTKPVVSPKVSRLAKAPGDKPEKTWKQKLAAWKKRPYPLTNKGAGIVRTIVEELTAAGKAGKSVTKDGIFGVLVRKFPKRDPEKMRRTVTNQVPTQLRQYRQMNVVAVKADGALKTSYYIPRA